MPEIINGRPSAASTEEHIVTDEAATLLNTTHRGLTSGNPHSVTPTELSLVIGTNTQAHGVVLDDLNTLGAPTSDGQFIVATEAGVFAYETTTVARTSLGVGEADTPTFGGIIVANNGTVGQVAGPLITFDDSNNELEITGADLILTGVTSNRQLQIGLGTNYYMIGRDNTSGRLDFQGSQEGVATSYNFLSQAGGSLLFVKGDGYVGIINDAPESPLTVGVNSTTQGILRLWDGGGGNTPGHIIVGSPNGTLWYLFVEDDGTVKVHNAAPTANANGSAIGDQTD